MQLAPLVPQLDEAAVRVTDASLTLYKYLDSLESDPERADAIERRLAASDYKFQTLIYEIVRSLPFQMRRGQVPEEKTSTTTKELARK